jgi:serine/threonine protein kinase
MATGKPPWYEVKAKTYFSLTNHIAQHEGPPTIPESLSPQLRAFLLRCFERNPSKRPRALELLNDPYLTENKPPTIALDLDAEMEPPHSPVPLERLIERLWTKVDPASKGCVLKACMHVSARSLNFDVLKYSSCLGDGAASHGVVAGSTFVAAPTSAIPQRPGATTT